MSNKVRRDPCAKCEEIHDRCTAHRSDGMPCGMQPMRGLTVCRRHGGSVPSVRAAAKRRVAEAEARRAIGDATEVNPTEALLRLIWQSAGHVQFYKEQVEKVAGRDIDSLVWGQTAYTDKTGGDDWGTTHVEKAEISVWLKLYNDERDRLADYASKAIKLGIEERRVRLAETQGQQVAEAMRLILADMYNRLTGEYELDAEAKVLWLGWIREIVPNRLREIAE